LATKLAFPQITNQIEADHSSTHTHTHIYIYIERERERERERDLVLRIELLFELGDLTLLGGGEVLGIVTAHLSLCVFVFFL
jgi:hypothetical protein